MHQTSNAGDGAGVNEQFGSLMKAAREGRGWSQRKLAEMLNEQGLRLDPSAVTRIETGQREVKLREAVIIAETVGLELANLRSAANIDRALEVSQAVAEFADLAQIARIQIARIDSAIDNLFPAHANYPQFVDSLGDVSHVSETDIRAMVLRNVWKEIRGSYVHVGDLAREAGGVEQLDKLRAAEMVVELLNRQP